ncbi:unnamed protein product [Meganyctiphanes norvegica]|uniref:Uncharacterized protein n=1 Tax=Meganyctiphanes norvegica TaxID=48144 RepID=A0AAV2PGG5_MEGNR
MVNSYVILICGVLFPALVAGARDCPNVLPDGACAQVFRNAGCDADHLTMLYGEETADLENTGWNDEITSVVVRDGCTYTGYDDHNFQGDGNDFQGIHLNLINDGFNDLISSHTCYC